MSSHAALYDLPDGSGGPNSIAWGSGSLAGWLLAALLVLVGMHGAVAYLGGTLRQLCNAIIQACDKAAPPHGEHEETAAPHQPEHKREQRSTALAAAPASRARGSCQAPQQVTVVVTDVQNSTLLWEGFPHEMNAAIEMHDELMRRQIAAHKGVELLTEGDSFQASPHGQRCLLRAPGREGCC